MGEGSIRPEAIPRHIAVIMDGNGRWAEERGLARTEGHRAGVDAVRKIVRAARDLGVSWLTLFAFSSENWNRPQSEVDELMKLHGEFFDSELPDAIENGIRIRMIGNRVRLPAHVIETMDEAIEATQENAAMRLTFALSYGGRGEIVEAARAQGVPVEYVIFEDEGHGFVKKENEIEGYGKVIEFLDTHLKGTESN